MKGFVKIADGVYERLAKMRAEVKPKKKKKKKPKKKKKKIAFYPRAIDGYGE